MESNRNECEEERIFLQGGSRKKPPLVAMEGGSCLLVMLSLYQVYKAGWKGHCALHSCEMSYSHKETVDYKIVASSTRSLRQYLNRLLHASRLQHLINQVHLEDIWQTF